MDKLLRYGLIGLGFSLVSSVANVSAKEVTPGSLQEKQAQKLVTALAATPVPCSTALTDSENSFFCATTARGSGAFRTTVDKQVATLKPVGPWASYTGEEGQQRSYVYKDGFMTVSYFPSSSAPKQNSWIVQYIMPED